MQKTSLRDISVGEYAKLGDKKLGVFSNNDLSGETFGGCGEKRLVTDLT